MNINRRDFVACAGAFFLPTPWRPQPEQREPVCIYESNESPDDLPDGWLLLGADASPERPYSEWAFNVAFIHRIYLNRINGGLIATIWLKGSPTPFEPYRCTVGDLPRLIAELEGYRRKVEAGRR